VVRWRRLRVLIARWWRRRRDATDLPGAIVRSGATGATSPRTGTSRRIQRIRRVGDPVGPYRITRVLVRWAPRALWYFARRTDPGNAPDEVLLQVSELHDADHQWRRMYFDESRFTLLRLDHPHLARIYELEATAFTFVARQHVAGATLGALIGRLPLDVALAIGIALCDALHYLHEHTLPGGQPSELVHGFVLPDNIVLGRDGGVLLYGDRVGVSPNRTLDELRGVLRYLSPEQLRGLPTDRRSDLYTVGTVLWELTTGSPRLPPGLTDDEAIARIKGDAQPPSTVRPDYPPALERIVMRALRRELDARYATADELRRELVAFAETLGPAPDLARFVHQVAPDDDAAAARFPPISASSAL
jgi:serine/threonine-protein kinase